MRPYILAETNWKTVKEERYQLVVLPWGATEAHNYHLPYSTDNIEAEAIAAEAARIAWEMGSKVIVLPVIPFGVNTGQSDIQLTINMNPSTQFAVLTDIIETLNRQEIFKLVILNSHGGNDFRQILRELGLKYPKMFLSEVNWYKVSEAEGIFEDLGEHAGEVETSLMLYLKPEWILPLSEAGNGSEKKYRFSGIHEGRYRDW
jgi:creatinine amidohydrolase